MQHFSSLAVLRRFGLGMGLIVVASAILLLSDPRRTRQPRPESSARKIAVVNYISVPVLEDGENGLMAGLAEKGFVEGRNLEVKHYNAEGDRATAILIAKEVVGGDADAVLTLSTPVLQAVANSNIETGKTHVFTLSTDPWGAGVGIHRDDPSQHPPYMTGYGTLQPVEAVFNLAREANPHLKKVGVAWNPSESNSEASTLMAREVCQKLGIDLVEATVDSSSAVLDAVKSLLNRDVEAIWAGGDSTVAAALDSLIGTARTGGVPVFTNMPSDVKQGALFALGADYFEVGRASGHLAAEVLNGKHPASIPVENYVPVQLAVNLVTLEQFQSTWQFGKDWANRAAIVVSASGIREAEHEAADGLARPEPGRTYHVTLVYFAPNEVTDATISGLKSKLAERGFVESQNVVYDRVHAQGDIALIPAIMQRLDQSDTDLIISHTTPCLTSAASIIRNKPVVFTEVYDPIAAGAGKSREDHHPNITGVGSFPPLDEMIDTMQAIVPDLKTIGIVYNQAEANSLKAVDVAKSRLRQRNLTLEEATVASTTEVLQAAQALTLKEVQVLWEVGDNTVNQGLEGLIKAANDAGIPVVNSDADSVSRGATVGVGISFYESGYAAGDVAADVLLGRNPARIPFQEVAIVRRAANLEAAKKLNLRFSDDFLGQCGSFHGVRSRLGRAAKVAFVTLANGTALDEAQRGVMEGLAAAKLKDGYDLEVTTFNAQGELSQLPRIFDTVSTIHADLVITSTTPAMIAATRSTDDTPIVFTVASNPTDVGLFPDGKRPKNLVGVYDNPSLAKLLDLATNREGTVHVVGTIWNPAEPNSEISVKRLREACRERNIKLIERNAAATNELREVASALCRASVNIVVISADNVTSSGFPDIVSVTSRQKVPVYCTEPDLVAKGATAAIGVNYYDWGRQSARMAAQILAGREPLSIPLEEVASIRTVTSD